MAIFAKHWDPRVNKLMSKGDALVKSKNPALFKEAIGIFTKVTSPTQAIEKRRG